MIAWTLALWSSPIARKIIIYAGIIVAICLSLRWYGNQQWAEGEAAGRRAMASELERQKAAEWGEKANALAAVAENIANEKRSVDAATEQLNRDRVNLSRSLNDALERIRAERVRQYADAAGVADENLTEAIRTALEALRK